jgi:hypothetical protein
MGDTSINDGVQVGLLLREDVSTMLGEVTAVEVAILICRRFQSWINFSLRFKASVSRSKGKTRLRQTKPFNRYCSHW